MAQMTVTLVATEPNVLRLETIQPDKLRPDEALVEIRAVGICHAEVSCLNGTIPVRFPNVFRHKGSYYEPQNAV